MREFRILLELPGHGGFEGLALPNLFVKLFGYIGKLLLELGAGFGESIRSQRQLGLSPLFPAEHIEQA